MAEEFSRTTARKRIRVGASFVDVPVITKISFIDPVERYQETQYTIDNSGTANREVHVDEVHGAGISLAVERIDKWTVLDPNDRGQETQISMDNVTGADSVPPHFSTHLKTHVVRYKNPDDADVWIDSELIDQFTVLDPNDRGQETIVTLNNPQNDDDAQANPDDPEISDPFNDVDPPWRTDPFQNIIDVSAGSTGIVEQIFVFRRYGDSCHDANLAVAQDASSASAGGDWYPVTHEFWYEKVHAGQAEPYGDDSPTSNPTAQGIVSITRMTTIASRTKLSDLITACVTLSHQFGQVPNAPDDGAFGTNPWNFWLGSSGASHRSCDPGLEFPFDVNQPSASNADHIFDGKPAGIYYGAVGYAFEDDLDTSGFPIPPGIPPWTPPT